MKITSVEISVFEIPIHPWTFAVTGTGEGSSFRWQRGPARGGPVPYQVMRVTTDEGVDGVCSVGDWRYTEMRPQHVAQLRELVIGEDPLNRESLNSKLNFATRLTFAEPGWFGGFDNCLWDIAGKVAGMPVAQLLGGFRSRCEAYHNTAGDSVEALLEDGRRAVAAGYRVLKDHLPYPATENIDAFGRIRDALGDEVVLLHDAALTRYTYDEAVDVGRALEELGFAWLEEPLPDRQHADYVKLCDSLDIPVAGAETLMHDPEISSLWLKTGACDILRVHARHGTTPLLKLATVASAMGRNVEPNALGPLFGLVHAHICCGISNITWFETSPPWSGTELAGRIGLMNPVVPDKGWIAYPQGRPGWGAEWDWKTFEKNRAAVV